MDRGDLSSLTDRERAFHTLIRANTASHDERRQLVEQAAAVLTVEEVYHASTVMALFNFYNTFVDVNGVAELTSDGYRASGVRLSTQGYAPPAPTPAPVSV